MISAKDLAEIIHDNVVTFGNEYGTFDYIDPDDLINALIPLFEKDMEFTLNKFDKEKFIEDCGGYYNN